VITGPLRNQVDRLWTEFWTGGITNPLTVIEQIRKQWFARAKAKKNDRKAKHFFVPLQEIEANKFDLSIGRYRETEYEEAQYEPPLEIMRRLRALDGQVPLPEGSGLRLSSPGFSGRGHRWLRSRAT
jgi:hypothetical protein